MCWWLKVSALWAQVFISRHEISVGIAGGGLFNALSTGKSQTVCIDGHLFG
jgi:hypothetical protein